MIPHTLSTISLTDRKTPAQRKAEMGWAGRFDEYGKGAVLPATQVVACPRVKVADLPEGFLKQNHIEALEHTQQIHSCCRHPENHDIEARKSHPDEQVPDIYIFYCTCGRKHRFFCVGRTDERPMWDAA